jgi:hypothetical protein
VAWALIEFTDASGSYAVGDEVTPARGTEAEQAHYDWLLRCGMISERRPRTGSSGKRPRRA